jgi:hypothetical protein
LPGWSVLDQQDLAVEDVVVDELEVGRCHGGERRLAASERRSIIGV